MYLGSPLLPLNISEQNARASIIKILSKKSWHEFEISEQELLLVPYFLFNYHYFLEQEKEGKQVIKSSFDGILAINGHKIGIEQELTELIKENMKKITTSVPKRTFSEKWCNIEKKEQEEVIKMKTAHFFGVPIENVVISSPKKVLIPFYKSSVKLKNKGEEYKFDAVLNAVDGRVSGLDQLKEREKSAVEITKETISDLKKPSAWIDYSKEFLVDTGRAVKSTVFAEEKPSVAKPAAKKMIEINLSFFESRAVLILIMLLALLLVYLAFFR